MMKKNYFLLLLGLLLLTGQEAQAEKKAQALRLSDNTLHFVYAESFAVGDTYKTKTVNNVWTGDAVLNDVSPDWGTYKTEYTKVVFDASFADARPKKCQFWFLDFSSLTTIEGLQYLNTSQVTTMNNMFANCYELTSLDLTTFNTQQVTNMGLMFYRCTKLQTLNLASFDTRNVTNMGSMFQGCTTLTTIYVSPTWSTVKVDTWSDMFKNCTSLKGGNGTIYNSEHTDKEYARIDVSDSKGYLTEYATVLLKDDADNAVTLTAYNGKTKNVQLMGRTLYRDGKWNTLCLPFAISALGGSPLEGATVMELDTNGTYALDGSPVENGPYKTGLAPNGTLYLYFKTANAIEAGKPYIVQWATTGEDIVNPVFTNVAISNTTAATIKASNSGYQNVEFVGAYSPTALDADDKSRLYLGSGNNLYYPSTTMTIGACRALFHVDISGSVNAVRAFNLAFSDPKTGIISTTNSTNFTNSDNSWYSLDGRKLGAKPTKKGLYIYRSAALENGKIVAIK